MANYLGLGAVACAALRKVFLQEEVSGVRTGLEGAISAAAAASEAFSPL